MTRGSFRQMSYFSQSITSSVLTLMKRRMPPYTRVASSSTCVPYVLFSVNAKLLPKELSTCVCMVEATLTLQSTIEVRSAKLLASRRVCCGAGLKNGSHLGCKVHDGVDLLCLQHVADEVRALDVCLDELRI